MKLCRSCGKEQEDAAKFCSNCGAVMSEETMAETSEGTVAFEMAVNTPPPPAAGTSADAAAVAGTPIPQKTENNLVKAIIATVCCCVPFGIVAIVYAAQVDTFLKANNLAAALEASKKANMWGNLAIGIGLLQYVLITLFYGAVFAASFMEAFQQ